MSLDVCEADRVEKAAELNGKVVAVVLADLPEAKEEGHANYLQSNKHMHIKTCQQGPNVTVWLSI